MATIRTICIFCRLAVELPSSDVELLPDDQGQGYHFDCPACHLHVDREAPESLLQVLRENGCIQSPSHLAREEALVAEFCAQLDDEREIARFLYTEGKP